MKYQEFVTKYKVDHPEAKKPEIDAAWKLYKEQNTNATGSGEGDTQNISSAEGEKAKFDVDRARSIFESHTVDKIYVTSDGTFFIEPQYARMHAATLESTDFITVKREEV